MVSEPNSAAVSGNGSPGVFGAFMNTFGSVMRHIQALAALAGFEAKAAARVVVKGIICLIVALLAAAFGYVLLILSLAFVLNLAFGISWLWILLGFTLLHFVGVAVSAFKLRSLFREKLFVATMREVRADIVGLSKGGVKDE